MVRVPRPGPGRPRSKITRLIADKGYDSHKLRTRFQQKGIDLICPHKRNITNHVQDGRKLRRYKRRWHIERTFSWLQSFKRVWTRNDRILSIYQGFIHIALALICLRRL